MGGRILIVDDARVVRSKIGYVLNKRGYEVFEAEDGLQGLRQTAKYNPDLILLDVKMPGIDGFEVQRRIRASTSFAHIPIIFFSAMGSIHVEQIGEAMARGVNDFVCKPVQLDKLLEKIAAMLIGDAGPTTTGGETGEHATCRSADAAERQAASAPQE